MSTPILQSLLDTDFYKFTMGHWVFKRYPNAVSYTHLTLPTIYSV